MAKVSEYMVYTWMSQSMDELMGTALSAEFENQHLHVVRGIFDVRPDFFPLWSMVQERQYLHWVWNGSEYWLFENGMMFQRRSYQGKVSRCSSNEVGDLLHLILARCREELESLITTRKFSEKLGEGGVCNQEQFIEWFIENYPEAEEEN